jgi:hypothetical protein
MIRRQQWVEIIKRWEESGLTQVDFCRKHDISLKSFYARKANLRKYNEEPEKTGSFVEVTPLLLASKQVSSGAPMSFQAQLPDGTALVFPVTVNPEYIADILSALRSR